MAIARWIGGFGANNQASSTVPSEAVACGSKEVEASKADYKQFGYENVCCIFRYLLSGLFCSCMNFFR